MPKEFPLTLQEYMTFAAGKCGEAQAEGAAYIPC